MNNDHGQGMSKVGIDWGERLPNVTGVDVAGDPFMLYDFFCGQPGAVWFTGRDVSSGALEELLQRLPEDARVLLVVPEGSRAPLAPRVRAVTDDGSLAERILGSSERVPRLLAHDARLRVLGFSRDVETLPIPPASAPTRQPRPIRRQAPVLLVDRILEPELCDALIEYHHRAGPEESPVYGRHNGEVVRTVDTAVKSRRDVTVTDPAWNERISEAVARRLLPEIAMAFAYRVRRYEAFKVVSYDAASRGHFAVHRDNLTPDARHRVFALTLALNDDYRGGSIVFPEFGSRSYRPPAGGALVFSGSLAHAVEPVTRGTRYALISFLFDLPGNEAAPAGAGAAAERNPATA